MLILFFGPLDKPSRGHDDLKELVEAWNFYAHSLKSTIGGILVLGGGVSIVSAKTIKS